MMKILVTNDDGVFSESLWALAAELFASRQGADYIRTHDVAALKDALNVVTALSSDVRV